jgi:hypothetical protein
VAVSPGDATKVALIRDDCPTFSWGEVEGAKSYDLVVYRLGEQNEHEEPVLRRSFPGSVYGWTPALDQCLERGGRYAWSVRAAGGKEASDWSSPSLFEVTTGPSEAEFEEAVQVVRQYLAEEATGSVGALASSAVERTESSQSATQVSGVPSSNAASSGGDAALQVNGSPVVTVATFLRAQCAALGLRHFDQGDGTVLDCNTGLIWLKDANCLEGSWTDSGVSGTFGTTLFFNLGVVEYSCTDYSKGTYSDWRVPTIGEFCSQDAPTPTEGVCPASAAPTSLVDTSVAGGPKVVNAHGDGPWSEGDAFVGVQNASYWSATEADTNNAWVVAFNSGLVTTAEKVNPGNIWLVRGGQ